MSQVFVSTDTVSRVFDFVGTLAFEAKVEKVEDRTVTLHNDFFYTVRVYAIGNLSEAQEQIVRGKLRRYRNIQTLDI